MVVLDSTGDVPVLICVEWVKSELLVPKTKATHISIPVNECPNTESKIF